ncbi:MAG TPA: Sec-independent protein translocase subunit TatA [Nocardioides sp.]|uniref:Sec-independent protein translocase subunit TatA n=1 Tax=Nocardioides sp. TaxID=35761 RepID=UPI002ED82284
MTSPFIANLGTTELLIILAVLILLFGATKLPELARGTGRALRIFKAETKGLTDDDDDAAARSAEAPRQIPSSRVDESSEAAEAERAERERAPRGDLS